MDEKQLEALTRETAKSIKVEADLEIFSRMLTKITIETALNAEHYEHLWYQKDQDNNNKNCRNGHSRKTLKTDTGQFELKTPRDRDGTFKPQLIKKQQTHFTSMDDKILFFYAKGRSTRDIVAAFKKVYDSDVSPTLISKVTNAVLEQIIEWQARPLDAIYRIVYLDCIMVKIHQNKQVINKPVYLAPGVTIEGHKELLGMWLSVNGGAKFWLSVLTELQKRGVKKYGQPQGLPVGDQYGTPHEVYA